MPLHFRREDQNFSLAVWKIEEDKNFFESKLSLTEFDNKEIEKIKAKNKLLQWFASRYLLKTLFNRNETLYLDKDEFGKPYVQNSDFHLSISHCRDYAGAIISKMNCGIDVETIDDRIDNISFKFLYEHEISPEIGQSNHIKKLTVYWSAKESLYKMYGKKGLTFKTQLIVDPFQVASEGCLQTYIRDTKKSEPFKVHYLDLEGVILSYVTGLLKDNSSENLR